MSPPASFVPRPLALIACRVIESELAPFTRAADHIVRQEFFPLGLHDRPDGLRTSLAAAIVRAEADPNVHDIALAYGLCGLALVGLAPRRCRLIVPRAHDCITLLLGSKERYAGCMRADPGTYWLSPGWMHGGRTVGPEREASLRREYTARFPPEEVEVLLAIERESMAQHDHVAYVDHGLADNGYVRRDAERSAHSLGWRFSAHRGDATLLRDLVTGPWDATRFLVVEPGEEIVHSVDEQIVRTRPVEVARASRP